MLRLALVALAALTALAVGWALLPDGAPPRADDSVLQRVWHANGTITHTDRFCGDCHYGLTQMWRADWTPRTSGNPTRVEPVVAWDLEVAPQWPEAPLWAVQAGTADAKPVLWESGELRQPLTAGRSWTVGFDVPAGASGVFARVHAEPSSEVDSVCRPLYDCPQGAVLGLVLVAPDGTRHEADGPDPDLRMIVVDGASAVAGRWTMEAWAVAPTAWAVPDATNLTDVTDATGVADLDQTMARVVTDGVAWIEVLGGDVVSHVPDARKAARFSFAAAAGGQPPDVWLRLQPHHDHTPYESYSWNRFDSSPFLTVFAAAEGPAPLPRTWTSGDIASLWLDAKERVVLERDGRRTGAYVDKAGHGDAGPGGSYPSFGDLGDPVWPGTARVRFELTWEPAVDLSDFGVRFSPASTPYFFDAAPVSRGPGAAVFETAVQPAWWEAPDQMMTGSHSDGHVTSFWDIAPYVPDNAQPARVESVSWHLRVVAVRG